VSQKTQKRPFHPVQDAEPKKQETRNLISRSGCFLM
jgi:hypothetical protein